MTSPFATAIELILRPPLPPEPPKPKVNRREYYGELRGKIVLLLNDSSRQSVQIAEALPEFPRQTVLFTVHKMYSLGEVGRSARRPYRYRLNPKLAGTLVHKAKSKGEA